MLPHNGVTLIFPKYNIKHYRALLVRDDLNYLEFLPIFVRFAHSAAASVSTAFRRDMLNFLKQKIADGDFLLTKIRGGCDWTRTNDLFDVNEAL